MYPAIVSERQSRCLLIPVVLAFRNVPTKGIQDRPVESFDLPIRLGMVSGRKHFLDPELSASCEEELRRELRTIIRQDMTGWTVRKNPMVAKGLCYRICRRTPKGNSTCELGKAIRHN